MSFPRRRESRQISTWTPAFAEMTDEVGVNVHHLHNSVVLLASGILDCYGRKREEIHRISFAELTFHRSFYGGGLSG